MMKYMGLYRPIGFKYNKFILFYTSDPCKHYKIIHKMHQKFVSQEIFEALKGLEIQTSLPLVSYSENKFSDYRIIHAKLLKYLSNSDIIRQKNVRWYHWPIV